MGGRGHRAQLILFLAAVFLPCALLIALSVRIVRQDRELRGKRQADERGRIAAQAEKALRAALDPVRRGEIRTELEPGQRYLYPETVFVAWIAGDRLALPWEAEHDRTARRNRDWIDRPEFGPAIRACDQVRSPSAGLAALNQCYERAVAAARQPAQTAYARWLWAGALAGAGQAAPAEALFRSLLDTGADLTDEEGIPLKLQAAQALAATSSRDGVPAAVESVFAARPWLSPMSTYVVTDVAARLARAAQDPGGRAAAESLRRSADTYVRLVQQAEALQNDYPRIGALLRSRPAGAWAPYGDELWLIGAAGDGGSAVLALRGAEVFRRLAIPGASRLAGAAEPEGQLLGEPFPGLKLVFAAGAPAVPEWGGDLQRSLLYLALVLVLTATLFAAYLLWRDLQRDLRLSELRAQFVSSVSHELKTPLTSIRMFAETLQMGRCANPETQAEYLGTIVNECERLSRLVDGVLLFSKTEQGKRIYRFRPTQAADAVRAAVSALDYPLSQEGFRLRIKLEEGLPALAADRDALEQAVLNLLSNAMKFSGEARDIELALYRENGEVVIRVADHGVGIAPEEQSRIFDKFYRVSTPENQLIPGTGLGLALVAQIVKAHGGRVVVESAPGKGSAFYLRLPAQTGCQNGQEVTT